MSDRRLGEQRVVHPRAVAEVGLVVITEMLALVRDMRNGTVKEDDYDQFTLGSAWISRVRGGIRQGCGTACCLMGHLAMVLDDENFDRLKYCWFCNRGPLSRLFQGLPLGEKHPSTKEGAAALERYVYEYAGNPWLNSSIFE